MEILLRWSMKEEINIDYKIRILSMLHCCESYLRTCKIKQKNPKMVTLINQFQKYLFPEWYETRLPIPEEIFEMYKTEIPKMLKMFQ